MSHRMVVVVMEMWTFIYDYDMYSVAQKNPENISNMHNKLNTCISSKCKSLSTVIGLIQFIYQQLLIIYLMSIPVHSYCIYY